MWHCPSAPVSPPQYRSTDGTLLECDKCLTCFVGFIRYLVTTNCVVMILEHHGKQQKEGIDFFLKHAPEPPSYRDCIAVHLASETPKQQQQGSGSSPWNPLWRCLVAAPYQTLNKDTQTNPVCLQLLPYRPYIAFLGQQNLLPGKGSPFQDLTPIPRRRQYRSTPRATPSFNGPTTSQE